jgi:hypothetical protein
MVVKLNRRSLQHTFMLNNYYRASLKTQRLRRAQEPKPQFTAVNEDFGDKSNEEIWSF